MRFIMALGVGVIALGMTDTARADPILVGSGAIHLDIEGDWFDLRGSGFAIRSTGGTGLVISREFASFCFPCRAGDLLDFSFTTIGAEQPVGFGPATFAGTSHPELFYRAELIATATAQRFPETTDSALEILQPFMFTGVIRAFTDPDFSTLAFSAELRGRGRASTHFFRDDATGSYFPEEGQLVYQFEPPRPIPEPGTLLLSAAGVAVMAARRRKSRR
jgi:hypothetical protein